MPTQAREISTLKLKTNHHFPDWTLEKTGAITLGEEKLSPTLLTQNTQVLDKNWEITSELSKSVENQNGNPQAFTFTPIEFERKENDEIIGSSLWKIETDPQVTTSTDNISAFSPFRFTAFSTILEDDNLHFSVEEGENPFVQLAQEVQPEPVPAETLDPTDPTAIRFQLNTSFEWENLKGNQGNTYGLLVVEPWIPLSEQDLLTVEIRLAMSELRDQPTFVGFGDMRIRYFHLIPITDGGILQALAPSLDLFVPTGDESRGLGGGSWVIAPNLVLALQLSDSITAYPFIRFVQSFKAVNSTFAADGGFPGEVGENQNTNISGLNIEIPITFQLADAWWFTVNPNFFQNFAGNQATSFSSKLSLTTLLTDSVSPTLEVNVPIAGKNTFDFGLKGTVTFFF